MNCRILRISAVSFAGISVATCFLSSLVACWGSDDEGKWKRGEAIYRDQCVSCHGNLGEGVDGGYTSPLVGDATVSELAKVIHDTMPEGEPETCVDEDALAVAQYIYNTFYSIEAQNKLNPPRKTFARLTANQLRQSYSDLFGHFSGTPDLQQERGARASYFEGERFNKEKLKITRIDPTIEFDFGRESPGEGIPADSFYIYWEGSLLPEKSGMYEIVVNSTCSFRFSLGSLNRSFIDNHVQSGDRTEFRQPIYLTAGRLYPFKIDFIQRKRKTESPPANIRLSWVPPFGAEETIPQRNIVAFTAPSAFTLQAPLPPDDRSYGFERGIAVDRQWDESTTAAAIEFAQIVSKELYPGPRARRDNRNQPDENRSRLRGFLHELLSVAFRSELEPEVAAVYIDQQLDQEPDDGEAIKRVLLMGLKSPRFLYPLIDVDKSASRRAANRLALTLYDSLPADPWLLKKIEKGELEKEWQIRDVAKHMIADYRAQAKIREMLCEWLALGQEKEITKSSTHFPEFSSQLFQDLKNSFNAQLEEIAFGAESDYRQLFLAKWAYSNPRIASFYGEEWKVPDENLRALQRVELKGDQRFGILTHPFLMSGLAYHDSTSPIHRGVFVIRYLLGRTLRPPNDAFSPLSPDLHPELTTRERVALQTGADNCQVCHIRINPLGFALENYDAVGRYRTTDRNKPIDATGEYRSRDDQQVTFGGAKDLAEYLADSPDAHRAFVTRAFQHLVKQPPDAFGPDILNKLTHKFVESRYNISQLVTEIAVIASLPPALPTQTTATEK